MTPERWRRTEELFHAALARPESERAAFLAAHGDDEALLEEVRRLLARADSDDRFLHGPASITAQDVIGGLEAGVLTGRTLGSYRVQSLLGAGGMGEVYHAHDVRLGRDVAIKILPPAFVSDPERLARFEREARILAALNHPNICAIYGIEAAEGVHYLILEFVEGESLADRLRRAEPHAGAPGGIAMASAVELARQVATALEAAHDKGIIHRDLKPANITITRDGVVKVLDFGLAKFVDGDASPDITRVAAPTTSGAGTVLLGTTAYMSPEQARGQPLDRRCDVWAFGCVLFEMLSGRRAFAGETVPDVISRILQRDPDWAALPAATPPALRRLLARCLEKELHRRLKDIGDARLELDSLDATSPSALDAPMPPPRRTAAMVLAGIAGAALGAAALWMWPGTAAPEHPLADADIVRLTNWDGNEEAAEISPDGKFVAFLSDRDGEFDIWLTQLGTGHFANLTRDVPPLAPGGAIVRKLGFSADGSQIWFNPEARRPLLLMPLTGGLPRPFLGEGTNTPAWAPDGTRLVYFGKPADGADPMFVADGTGANARQLVAPRREMKRNNPVWSADGQWIYFVSGSEPQDEIDIDVWRVRASGGEPEQLTHQHAAANFLAPIDARTLLYTARAEDGSGPWLWSLDVERAAARRLPLGVEAYTSIAASRDGRRLVATIANPSASLWAVPIRGASAAAAAETDAAPYTLPAPTGRAFAPRFGPRALFYLSARGTGDGLWKLEDGRAMEVWRDLGGPVSEPPAVSADGRTLAVIQRRQGKRHLLLMSSDGTNPRNVAPALEIEGAAGQGGADWSPDGKWLVTAGRDTAGPGLFTVNAETGEHKRLLAGKWGNPVWSPRGDLIVYAGRSLVGRVALAAIRPDGREVTLPQIWVRPGGYRFLRDGSGVVYLPGIHASDFWLLDVQTLRTRQLTHLAPRGGLRTFDVTPDGTQLVFDRSRENSDVVVIDRRTK